MSELHSFVVTSVEGHVDVTNFSDLGPQFVEVMITATNHLGETIQLRRSLDDQPKVGETITFEHIPQGATITKERW